MGLSQFTFSVAESTQYQLTNNSFELSQVSTVDCYCVDLGGNYYREYPNLNRGCLSIEIMCMVTQLV